LDWGSEFDWWLEKTGSTKVPKKSVLTIGKQTETYLHERQQQSSLRLESEMEDSWEFPIDSAKLMGQEILEGF
jgi:hypothetical protein